jgi:hypothetical protein
MSATGVASQAAAAAQNQTKLTVAYPPVQPVGGKLRLTCLSLMESELTGSADKSLTGGIEGKVTPGQNGASISIRSASTLMFQSDAGAKLGGPDGAAAFTIVSNDTTQVVAYYFDGRSMSSLVVNKANGLAIWSKIRSTFPVYDAPTGGSSYFVCR